MGRGNWTLLAKIALTDPHAAYSCFIHGYQHKFMYVMRTIRDISSDLIPLDEAINGLIASLFYEHTVTRSLRQLIALPVKLGGLGMMIPSHIADDQYEKSIQINKSLINGIVDQASLSQVNIAESLQIKSNLKKETDLKRKETATQLKEELNDTQKKIYEAITEVGASAWLTVLPLKKYSFKLAKQKFRDSLRIRYGISF